MTQTLFMERLKDNEPLHHALLPDTSHGTIITVLSAVAPTTSTLRDCKIRYYITTQKFHGRSAATLYHVMATKVGTVAHAPSCASDTEASTIWV